KHAVEGLMLCLRLELQGSGIHVSLIEPGPVTSRIASNGLPYFTQHIDIEASVHHVAYQKQLERLNSGGRKSVFKPGPEAVYRVLRRALEHPRPRPHYVVTLPAKIGAGLKRLLPPALLYRILARQD